MGYAFKKDTKGERHGTPAERLLAAQMKAHQNAQSRPNQLFATGAVCQLETESCTVSARRQPSGDQSVFSPQCAVRRNQLARRQ